MNSNKKEVVITYGTFDLLHVGHINILQRAKALGNYLIVGVTGEDYDRSRGKLNVVQSVEDRVNAVKSLNLADLVIVEHHKHQKPNDIKKYNVDKFVIGDDWIGKFDHLQSFCQVIYLPRTEGISSTLLRSTTANRTLRLGIVGTGRIAQRFVKEASHVESLEIHSVVSRNISNVEFFAKENNISWGYDNYTDFLNSGIDAVYIASPHEYHFEHAKLALESGKHVLCEKPITLSSSELSILFELANQKNLILLEAIKTAFFQAFIKIKNEIRKGKIGEVLEVRSSFSKLTENKKLREWTAPYGGAVNELASYNLLLAQKILGSPVNTQFYSKIEAGVDSYTNIISNYSSGAISICTVGIGGKTEGCAIISGTKGYIYIPAPWWLTKTYSIRGENPHHEQKYFFDFEGDGLRYEIAEFVSMIFRGKIESTRYSQQEMISINKIISDFQTFKKSSLAN